MATPVNVKKESMVKQVVEMLKKGKSTEEILKMVKCAKGTVSVQRSKLKKAGELPE